MGSALLALLVHLDGSGAVTFLVTVPAMLPLFERLRMDRRILACVVSMAAGVNFLPVDRPDAAGLGRRCTSRRADLFRPLIPVQLVGLVVRLRRRVHARPSRGAAPGRDAGRQRSRRGATADARAAGAATARPLLDQCCC